MTKLNIIVCEDSLILSNVIKKTFPILNNSVIVKPESFFSVREFYKNYKLTNEENWIFTTTILIMDVARAWQKENKVNELNITWINKDSVSFSPFKDGRSICNGFWSKVLDIQTELLDKLLQ